MAKNRLMTGNWAGNKTCYCEFKELEQLDGNKTNALVVEDCFGHALVFLTREAKRQVRDLIGNDEAYFGGYSTFRKKGFRVSPAGWEMLANCQVDPVLEAAK